MSRPVVYDMWRLLASDKCVNSPVNSPEAEVLPPGVCVVMKGDIGLVGAIGPHFLWPSNVALGVALSGGHKKWPSNVALWPPSVWWG